MPYHVQRDVSSNLFYVEDDTGKRFSHHPMPLSRAEAQLRALYVHEFHHPKSSGSVFHQGLNRRVKTQSREHHGLMVGSGTSTYRAADRVVFKHLSPRAVLHLQPHRPIWVTRYNDPGGAEVAHRQAPGGPRLSEHYFVVRKDVRLLQLPPRLTETLIHEIEHIVKRDYSGEDKRERELLDRLHTDRGNPLYGAVKTEGAHKEWGTYADDDATLVRFLQDAIGRSYDGFTRDLTADARPPLILRPNEPGTEYVFFDQTVLQEVPNPQIQHPCLLYTSPSPRD